MASTTYGKGQSAAAQSSLNSIQVLLRLEGLAAAAVTAVLYAHSGASWWLFAALWLAPDLSMLGYLGGPCRGARVYNAVHSYVTPQALALAALVLHARGLLPFALIWANHIAVDRALGYAIGRSILVIWQRGT